MTIFHSVGLVLVHGTGQKPRKSIYFHWVILPKIEQSPHRDKLKQEARIFNTQLIRSPVLVVTHLPTNQVVPCFIPDSALRFFFC